MKLDDRPGIEQLLNPTPLNVVQDLRADYYEWVLNQEGEGMTTDQVDAACDVLNRFADALEARL